MRYFTSFTVLALVLFAGGTAFAQTTSGSISGSVVDAQGQVVPGADVVATNQQTQEVRRTVTNEVGLFAFPALQPGPYTIRAELSGFRPIEIRDNMVLATNRLAIPPLRLEVGTLAEAVTVSAVGEVVATTQTSHQALLDLKQVENLSIRGRDPMSMLKILPGVQLLANDNETVGGGFQSPVPSLQGGSGQTVYVDGINAGDSGAGNNLSGTTVLDAVAEVNVQMSAYTAEYGLKGGSQINVITKHGGAEYHGTGYWYRRHESWNSINYFNKITNRPKPQYRYSNLGGTLGGPIPRIKGINPNGNKLFFFYVHRRHAGIETAEPEVLPGADGARARRRLLAVGHTERRADPHQGPANGPAVPRQPDSAESSGSTWSGFPRSVSDAEHDGRERLQLPHAGAELQMAAPAAHVPRRLSADGQRLARGEVPDVLHQVCRYQRRCWLVAVGLGAATL